jgi:hypothetical protein
MTSINIFPPLLDNCLKNDNLTQKIVSDLKKNHFFSFFFKKSFFRGSVFEKPQIKTEKTAWILGGYQKYF